MNRLFTFIAIALIFCAGNQTKVKAGTMDKEMKCATGCQAYANTRFLYYINEIRSAVLIVHGEKAHSRYFGESAFRYMMDGKAEGYDFARKPNPVPNNKQLLIIPGASHCDLYDGGGKGLIPWDNIEEFLKKNLKR